MCIIVSLRKCRLWVTFKVPRESQCLSCSWGPMATCKVERRILFSVFEIRLHLCLLREQRRRLQIYSRSFPADWYLAAMLQSQFCVRWKGRHSLSMIRFNSEMDWGSAGGHCAFKKFVFLHGAGRHTCKERGWFSEPPSQIIPTTLFTSHASRAK